MDLERCPKCGDAWRNGADKCFKCGFVPIGVGLDKVKKKKKRVRRYVEPGSWRSFLSFGATIGLVAFCAVKQPWTDDWELVRGWFGQGRHHSVVGEWDIVKSMAVDKSKAILSSNRVKKGYLKFTDKGQVKFSLQDGSRVTGASGTYQVAGVLVAMNDIHVEDEGDGIAIPPRMNFRLAWTGPDSLVASCNGAEAVYLRRRGKGNGLLGLIHSGIKPGQGETPEEVKGLADKMTAGVRNADKD